MLRAVRFPMIFEALKYKQITGQLSKKKFKKKKILCLRLTMEHQQTTQLKKKVNSAALK